jgi:hypothetical protein
MAPASINKREDPIRRKPPAKASPDAPVATSEHPVLALQRLAGNQSVQGLIETFELATSTLVVEDDDLASS